MSKSNGIRIQLIKYNSETKKSLNSSNSLIKSSRNTGPTINKRVKKQDSNSDSLEVSTEKITYSSQRNANMPRKPMRINLLCIKNVISNANKTPRENSPSSDNKRNTMFNAANEFLNSTTRSSQKLKKVNFIKFVKIERHIPYLIKFLKINEFRNIMNSGKRMRILIDSAIRNKTYPILNKFKQIRNKLPIVNSKFVYNHMRSKYSII
jgi:hypothetical protein